MRPVVQQKKQNLCTKIVAKFLSRIYPVVGFDSKLSHNGPFWPFGESYRKWRIKLEDERNCRTICGPV